MKASDAENPRRIFNLSRILPILCVFALCTVAAFILTSDDCEADETTFDDGKLNYAIVSETDLTVAVTGMHDTTMTTVKIQDTVLHDDKIYTVIGIADGAFKDYDIITTVIFGSLENITSVGSNVFDKEFKDNINGATFDFSLGNIDLFREKTFMVDDSGTTPTFCRTCEVEFSFEVPVVKRQFAGTYVERPENPVKENMAFNGWYEANLLYTFDIILDRDLRLQQRWSGIEEDGSTVIDAVGYNVTELDFKNEALKSATIVVAGEAWLTVEKGTCDEIVSASMFVSTHDRYVINVAIDGIPCEDCKVTATVPYNPDKGLPAVYCYHDGTKDRMQFDIDKEYHLVTFATTHNSLYGIEYQKIEEENTTVIVVIAVCCLIALAIIAFSRRHRGNPFYRSSL